MFEAGPFSSIIPLPAGVANVLASPSSGTFSSGTTITITVVMNQNGLVVTGGSPTLLLNSGSGTATYVSTTGSNLVFSYTVGAGDNANPLVLTGISLNGAVVANVNGTANFSGIATVFTGLVISNAGLPTGLIQSTPLGGGAFSAQLNQSSPGPSANSDGITTGWSTGNGTPAHNVATILQIWWNCPADQYYQFVIPAYCGATAANPGNAIIICIDQLPIPSDSGTTGNLNWWAQTVNNVGAGSLTNYSFTVPVKQGLHSIQVYLASCSFTNNNLHGDRLNIIGTGTAFPVEPSPQTRNPALFPYSSYHWFNVPFGLSAQFLALNNPVAQSINGTGGNGASIQVNANSFSSEVWVGQATDPIFSLTTNDNFEYPTSPIGTPIPVRSPAGANCLFDNDNNNAFVDSLNPRYTYSGLGGPVTGRSAAFFRVLIADSYNLDHAVPQSAGMVAGLIRVADLDSGVIAHRILGGLAKTNSGGNAPGFSLGSQTGQFTGMPWPACESDADFQNYTRPTGTGVPYGSTLGIPGNITMPVGLNAATQMAWIACQNYGIFLNVATGTYPTVRVYAEPPAVLHPMLTGINWSQIVPSLSVMSNPSPVVLGASPPTTVQGFGGGAPRVALRPGLQQGLASIGQSPYSFPTSPVGIPIQVCANRFLSTIGSNVNSSSISGTARVASTIPTNSFVLVFLSFDRVPSGGSGQGFTSLTDTAGNTYQIVQPTNSIQTWHPTLAYCLSTTAQITNGISWTAQFSPTGFVFWSILGAYYRPPPPSGSATFRTSANATNTSSVTTLGAVINGIQQNDLVVGITASSSFATITSPTGFGELINFPPFAISFAFASVAGSVNFQPTWNNPSAAALAVAAFANVNRAS